MKTRLLLGLAVMSLVIAGLYSLTPAARAQGEEGAKPSKAAIGEAAPDFMLKDVFGKEFKLSEFKGKIVVLEWLNPGCPVVKEHHGKKTMQNAYKDHAENVVWLGIDSTGGANPEKERVYAARAGLAYPILMDGDGKVGRSYGATNTPHMFVIDKAGKLAYAGAIDDQGSTNYVVNAVEALAAGKTVAKPKTEPYGCKIHWAK